jgi:phosphoribosylaminoimidazole-succinocarboxamide synthase
LLKSTIYSHTNQHTGEIADLGRIRAAGSNLFLEMLRRNNLKHAYIGVNPEGVILSKRIETNAIEVVFKK